MKNNLKFGLLTSKRQSGIATILMVVLMGVAMTAAALGLIFSLKNTQEKQVAVHASTHAQVGLWSGVEAFRRYLGSLDNAALLALGSVDHTINLGVNYGAITAKNVGVNSVGAFYHVSAEIVNVHADSQSSSAVGVTFKIDPNACENCVELSASLDFYHDLDVTGGIVFQVPGGPGATINVEGSIDILNVSISAMNSLSATGNITLNSGVEVSQVYSNGDVSLTQNVRVDKAWALGSIFTDGGSIVTNMYANGSITANASGDSDVINSRSDITVGGGSSAHDYIKAGGTLAINTGGDIQDVQVVGDVTLTTEPYVHSLIGMGSIQCGASDWSVFDAISVNGLATGCPDPADSPLTVAASNTVNVMEELTPFSMSPFIIDTRALKSKANLAFTYDTDTSRMQVEVKNINGITDGIYDIGSMNDNHKNYLCATFSGSTCTELEIPNLAVCLGYSLYNDCVSYNVGTNTWIFNGTGTIPGILWFEGNVNLGSGVYYSTILATGDVTSSGEFKGISVNYGGYAEICETAATHIVNKDGIDFKSMYKGLFEDKYPTNLCEGGEYQSTPTGNIGIAAGSYTDGSYGGGNIDLTAKNEVFGSILAGNLLQTSGDTTVHGYVTAAVLGSHGGESNELGASTVIDLRDAPSTYAPTIVPSMVEPCTVDCEPNNYAEKSKVLWSRYL